MWASRWSLPVEIDEASMSICNLSVDGSPDANSAVPDTPGSWPRTVEIPRWRTLKRTSECAGSRIHDEVGFMPLLLNPAARVPAIRRDDCREYLDTKR